MVVPTSITANTVWGNKRVVYGTHLTTGDTTNIETGLTTVERVFLTMETDPAAGAGDPFIVTGAPSATAGGIDIRVAQDDATAATVAATVSWMAIGV